MGAPVDPNLRDKVAALRKEGLGPRRIARLLKLTPGQAAGMIHRMEAAEPPPAEQRRAPPAIAKAGRL